MASEEEKKRRAAANRKAARTKANKMLDSARPGVLDGTMADRLKRQQAIARAIRKNKDEQLWEDAYPDDWRERMKR